jgi:hypothetical protein
VLAAISKRRLPAAASNRTQQTPAHARLMVLWPTKRANIAAFGIALVTRRPSSESDG